MKHPVFGETVRGDSILKMANAMDDGAKFMRRHKIPPMIFSELWFILGELHRAGRAETIVQEVKDVCEYYGFETDPVGIGGAIS